MGLPLISGDKFPPVIAITVSSRNSIPGPMRVDSITASASWFPTKILAILWAKLSITPETGTPYCWYPLLPLS